MDMRKVLRPRPLRSRPNTDRSKFCAFHDQPGHNTDEFYELRDAIEKFVRDGKLRQYVIKTQGRRHGKREPGVQSPSPATGRSKEEKRCKVTADDEFLEVDFQCNSISGGFGGGGDTVSQRKKYLREINTVRDLPQIEDNPSRPKPPPLVFTSKN